MSEYTERIRAADAARTAIDEAYRYIVKSINAMLHLEQLTGCEEFVDTMNAVIHRYKTMINQQHGHHHGTGTTPSTPTNPPDVIGPVGGEADGEE
ncbi:hypothetical protein R80B4_00682 [Fibrobacteres bacterium R8-0-B4]